jgi:hypothetical protein
MYSAQEFGHHKALPRSASVVVLWDVNISHIAVFLHHTLDLIDSN